MLNLFQHPSRRTHGALPEHASGAALLPHNAPAQT
jgi:hypothetical protein